MAMETDVQARARIVPLAIVDIIFIFGAKYSVDRQSVLSVYLIIGLVSSVASLVSLQ
jgi:hypothetical protein